MKQVSQSVIAAAVEIACSMGESGPRGYPLFDLTPKANAHPHRAGSVLIVHNGIIENYPELRAQVESSGCDIQSDTDTELIAHLIDLGMRAGADLLTAVREACRSPAARPSRTSATVATTAPGRLVETGSRAAAKRSEAASCARAG